MKTLSIFIALAALLMPSPGQGEGLTSNPNETAILHLSFPNPTRHETPGQRAPASLPSTSSAGGPRWGQPGVADANAINCYGVLVSRSGANTITCRDDAGVAILSGVQWMGAFPAGRAFPLPITSGPAVTLSVFAFAARSQHACTEFTSVSPPAYNELSAARLVGQITRSVLPDHDYDLEIPLSVENAKSIASCDGVF